ncbi:MAG: cache domain-containing protein, partial [Spirochaetaceae bacterium]|nr:cache domain-containing protein [Spirochaetaceae bacterium]
MAALVVSAAGLIILSNGRPGGDRLGVLDYASEVQGGLSRSLKQTLESVENLSFQWIASTDLNRVLAAYSSSRELYDVSEPGRVFSEHLEAIARTLPAVEDAVFLDLAEPRRKALTMREHLPLAFVKGLRNDPVVVSAAGSEGRAVWGGPRFLPEGGNPLIACARLVKGPGGAVLGCFVVLVNERILAATLNDRLFVDGEPGPGILRGDLTFIVDADGRLLSSPDRALLGLRLADTFPAAAEAASQGLDPSSPDAGAGKGGSGADNVEWVWS